MKKHAVLITILFAYTVALFSVTVVFFEFYKLNKQLYIDRIFTKNSIITQIYRMHTQRNDSQLMIETNLAIYKLQMLNDEKLKNNILKKSKVLKRKGFRKFNQAFLLNRNGFYTKNTIRILKISMLSYKHSIYFYLQDGADEIIIKDESLKTYPYFSLLYTYLTVIGIITIAFLMILQKLKPLILLRRKIIRFGDGDMEVSFRTKSTDEIGSVSNELESARAKIQTLLESRTLFLRNIMHELKTPIAKGTIATQMLPTQKQRDRFSSIFKRLENLINEFALIEEVTSIDDKSSYAEYRVVDIIDGAIDMAMVERDCVSINVDCDRKIFASYRLYTTAIKNMIDNAMKYSSNHHITISIINDELCFENLGECLKQPLHYYIEPFTKDNPSKNSFGLGLYLVDSILQAHGQVLAHEYHDGVNRFIFA